MRGSLLPAIALLLLATTATPLANLVGAQGHHNDGLAALTVHPASSDTGQLKTFTVIVGRTGFNGSSGELRIQVSQGDRVRITFVYGDGDLKWDNPHVVGIEGYNIVTGVLSRANPVETVEFTANQVGTFSFRCTIPCLGMENLQRGLLVVLRPEVGGAVATRLSHTRIELRPPNLLHITARLVDERGAPVAGAIIEFHLNTALGRVKLGSNATGPDGSAHLLYPLPSIQRTEVTLLFPGGGVYLPSEALVVYTPEAFTGVMPESPYIEGQNPLPDLRLVGVEPHVTLFLVGIGLLVVGSVWMTFAYAIAQVVKMRRHALRRLPRARGVRV